MNTNTLVQKLRNCCNVLRDDGMSCGDWLPAIALSGPEGGAGAVQADCW